MGLPLRVVFLGSDEIALSMLGRLVEMPGVELAGVWTQPDRAVGRGQKVVANEVKTWAVGRGVKVWQPEKLGAQDMEELRGLKADLGLVMAYGHILREEFLTAPRLGMLNFHGSLLPELRGASPIQTAVATGMRETGISLMRVVREMDAGAVADVERVAIGERETSAELWGKMAAACVPLLERTMGRILRGEELPFVEQDAGRASWCRKLVKEDGGLDFSRSAAELAARVNGLFPWPGVTVELKGQVVKVGLADVAKDAVELPVAGKVLGSDGEGLLVGTGEGVLRLLKLQRAGGKMLGAVEFLRGFPVEAGVELPSREMRELARRK